MNETREETVERLKNVGTMSGSCINAIFTHIDFIGKKETIPEIIEQARAYGESVVGFVSPDPLDSEVTKYGENSDGINRFRFFPQTVQRISHSIVR
ncbi:MAG: hypothetical protein WDZ74_01850 [Candidatus Paceibacterota bacterium]